MFNHQQSTSPHLVVTPLLCQIFPCRSAALWCIFSNCYFYCLQCFCCFFMWHIFGVCSHHYFPVFPWVLCRVCLAASPATCLIVPQPLSPLYTERLTCSAAVSVFSVLLPLCVFFCCSFLNFFIKIIKRLCQCPPLPKFVQNTNPAHKTFF